MANLGGPAREVVDPQPGQMTEVFAGVFLEGHRHHYSSARDAQGFAERVEDALRLAAEADLDLVEVAPMAKPPVAKLMDFGKYKYEAAVKARESRKNQANTVLKEVRFRLKIDTHDYETKVAAARAVVDGGMSKPEAMVRFGIASATPLKQWCRLYREGGAQALKPKPKGRPKGSVRAVPPTREEELAERVRKLEAQVAYLKKSIALKAQKRSQTGTKP